MSVIKICDRVVLYSFYLLFFLVPLILTPFSYELFEFNKMITVYLLTTLILGAWLIKMVAKGEIRIQRTPLDIPILLFFIFNFFSFIFSIDRHVSFWGYYSRFHGGLLSTICYIILYYAFVTKFGQAITPERGDSPKFSLSAISERLRGPFKTPKVASPAVSGREKFRGRPQRSSTTSLHRLLTIILASASLVSIYGILEHFGIDKEIWVQDVKNRVFSTLGQPNWLAAYLAILIPVAMAVALNEKSKIKNFTFYFLIFIFYLCLLYTKSRSGFLGFWISNIIFTLGLLTISSPFQKFHRRLDSAIASSNVRLNQLFQPRKIWQKLLIFNLSFLTITFFIGSPFAKINQSFTFSSLASKIFKKEVASSLPSSGPALETGGTESGEIRKIVWRGAVDIARHYPLFGSGVETFAFAYYKFRPKEHNLTSEWDFLYNKAHNEYLNYAATTGFLGLSSYLLLIGSFIWWNFKKILDNFGFWILDFGFLAGYVSILITNFFGFSVVTIALFFWLIPAICFTLSQKSDPKNSLIIKLPITKPFSHLAIILILLFTFYFLIFNFKLWYADFLFAKGSSLLSVDEDIKAYPYFQKAVTANPGEPLYRDKFSLNLANLAVISFLKNEATLSAELTSQALSYSQKVVTSSPKNVNFWKTRTKVFYTLSQIDEKYTKDALESLLRAKELAPTDAKISYNLALLYAENKKKDLAIKTLGETISLKPNYRDARFALAIFYKEKGLDKEAKEELKYILRNINPNDEEVKEELKKLRQ